jgi:hypothetical protein
MNYKAHTVEEHARACGARTEQCANCNSLVMLRDLAAHEVRGTESACARVRISRCLLIDWDSMCTDRQVAARIKVTSAHAIQQHCSANSAVLRLQHLNCWRCMWRSSTPTCKRQPVEPGYTSQSPTNQRNHWSLRS